LGENEIDFFNDLVLDKAISKSPELAKGLIQINSGGDTSQISINYSGPLVLINAGYPRMCGGRTVQWLLYFNSPNYNLDSLLREKFSYTYNGITETFPDYYCIGE